MTNDEHSQLNIGGDVGPGSAIGKGKVTAQNIAGGDIIFQNVTPSERQIRLTQLKEKLDRQLAGLIEKVQTPPLPVEPYLGLSPYTLGHRRQFFGREKLTEQMMAKIALPSRINTCRLLIIYGQPGVGKTSLVDAGLQPRLIEQGYLPIYIPLWRQSPIEAFYHRFLEDVQPTASLYHVLDWIAQAVGKRLYLIFDQFEAFFGPYFDDRQRIDFIAQLAECLQAEELDVVFILVVRTEQYAGFNTFKPRIPAIFDNEIEVPLLTRTDGLAAIKKPLLALNVHPIFTDDLLTTILDDIDDHGIDPTQLQIICDMLWDRCGPDNSLDVEAYKGAGEWKGLLGQYLQSVFDRRIRRQDHDISRGILVSLLSSEGKSVLKTRRQLDYILGNAPGLENALDNLTNLGLIYAEADPSGQMVYSLSQRYLEKVIKVDPEAINRKRAEELFEAGMHNFGLYQFPLAEDAFQFIKREVDKGVFNIPAEAVEFWQGSRRASVIRHLIFRALMASLFGALLIIPALTFGIITSRLDPALRPDWALNLVLTGLSAAVLGSFFNGFALAVNTALEYWLPHWSRWKRIWLFLAATGGVLAVLIMLIQFSGESIFTSPDSAFINGLLIGLFFGAALYLSLPPTPAGSWWRQMRPSLMAGPIFGLLLVVLALLDSSSGGSQLSPVQQRMIWLEYPVYFTTLTASFALGLEVGDRLLLGPPSSILN